jgi:hypothetical protein
MLRPALAAVALALCVQHAALAQSRSFTGSWSTTTPRGTSVTLQLTQNARGQVSGNLAGTNGTAFAIAGRVQRGQLTGYATGTGTRVYVHAAQSGATITLTLSDVGPDGQPIATGQSQQLVMTRAAAVPAMATGPATMGQPGTKEPSQAGGQPPMMGQGEMGAPARRGAGAAAGDPYVGSFVGNDLTITLQRRGQYYVGTAVSNAGQYQLQAQLAGGILTGAYNDNGQQRAFQAQVQGDVMQLAADGTQIMLQRQSGMAGGQMAQPGMGQPGMAQPGMGQPGGAGAGGGGVAGNGPQDRQLAQLLLSSRWCHFTYSQTSGTSNTERAQFFPDGNVVQSSGAETYNSGSNGTVAGQSSGGERGMWRVQNGMLMLSQDGANWTPTQLQVTRNSNGYPIVTSGGKEYSQCN